MQGMRRLAVLPFALLVLCGHSAVMTEVVDVGVVDAHRTVDCSFALTNTTGRKWSFQSVQSSCACLQVSAERGDVLPQAVLPVAVSFDPAGMEGPVEKTVIVNFKPGPQVTRTFRADVRPRLWLRPSVAAFGVVCRSDAERVIDAHLGGYATNAVITAIIPPTNSFFDVTVGSAPRADRADRSLTVRFKNPASLPGTYAETWRIRTSDPEISEIAFPVSARIADGFTVTPQVLTVGWNDPVCSRSVVLRPEPGHPAFKVLAAETCPRKWGDVKILPRPLGGWQVAVENIDPAIVRQFSKKPYLEVETDLSDCARLRIPLQIAR